MRPKILKRRERRELPQGTQGTTALEVSYLRRVGVLYLLPEMPHDGFRLSTGYDGG